MKVPYKLLGAFSPAFRQSKAGKSPQKRKELIMGAATLNWFNIRFTFVQREQYNAILESLRADPNLHEMSPSEKSVVRRISYFYNRFMVIEPSPSCSEIRVVMDRGQGVEAIRYKYIATLQSEEDLNESLTGGEAYEILDRMFAREHHRSIFKAYTAQKYKDLFPKLKKCVPSQPHYAKRCEIMDHGYKADVSSCFPAELSKSLPTLNGSIIVDGRVDPSEEYPFAFYLESHHLAILDEFDTKELRTKWYDNYYAKIYDDLVPEKYEKTLLCPACKYTFKNVMRELYDHRKQHAENKDIMNKTIGVFHYTGNPRLAHVAAVVIARCIYSMNERADALTRAGCTVYHIATDAIIWRDPKDSPLDIVCVDPAQKDLGKFMLEEANMKFCIRSTSCYQYIDHDGDVITKFSGNVDEEVRSSFKLGDVLTYKGADLKIRQCYRDKDGCFREA